MTQERAERSYEPLKVIEEGQLDKTKYISNPIKDHLHQRNLTTFVPMPLPNPDAVAFSKFKSLGGTFYNQKERQIITMDSDGGLHYEHRRPDYLKTVQ